MKRIFYTAVLLLYIVYIGYAKQVYETDNGVTASGGGTARKVSLGGALTGNTAIPFDGINIHLQGWATAVVQDVGVDCATRNSWEFFRKALQFGTGINISKPGQIGYSSVF